LFSRQIQAQKGFHFGLVTGVHKSYLQDDFIDDSPNYDGVRKYSATGLGLAVGYHFSDNLGIKVEVFANDQGQRWNLFDKSGAQPVRTGELVNHYRYIVLPAYFNVKGKKGFFRLNFQAGVQYVSLLRGYEYYSLISNSGPQFLSSSRSSDNARFGLNKTDIQAIFGLGFNLHINKELYLTMLGRLNYGFIDMRDDKFQEALKDKTSTIYSNLRKKGYSPRNNYGYLVQVGIHYSPF